MTLRPLGIAPHLRPLSSAGITRPPRYYGPLRDPAGPTRPSRAVGWRVPRHRTGLPVLRLTLLFHACCRQYPGGTRRCVCRSLPDRWQPSPLSGRVGFRIIHVSRPARRSLVLRPAWSLSRPWRPVTSECFRRYRCLHHPLRLLPAGATVAGRDSHPLKNGAFHGAPDKGGGLCQTSTGRVVVLVKKVVKMFGQNMVISGLSEQGSGQ